MTRVYAIGELRRMGLTLLPPGDLEICAGLPPADETRPASAPRRLDALARRRRRRASVYRRRVETNPDQSPFKERKR